MNIGDLTDAEVAEFAPPQLYGRPRDNHLRDLLGDGVVTPARLLFIADPGLMTRSLLRELQWLDKQEWLSTTLSAYVAGDPPTRRWRPPRA